MKTEELLARVGLFGSLNKKHLAQVACLSLAAAVGR
jgi:hypothetical protein